MMLLEEIFKEKKAQHSDAFNLRIRRSLSWLKQSTEQQQTPEFKWVSLWIAFYAIYAENSSLQQQPEQFKHFVQGVLQYDRQGKLKELLYSRLVAKVQEFFAQTWSVQNHMDDATYRNIPYATEKQWIEQAWQQQDVPSLLYLLMRRLSALYEQMLKGGMSYQSQIHHETIILATQLMSFLVPAYLQILLENATGLDDAEPYYPVRHMH